MSIFHLSVKIIGRSSGRSAVAAAAYRSGSKLKESETGKTYNYEKKHGVIYSEIDLPSQAPKEFADRQKLWNSVQAVEKSKNAQLAREIEFALPREIESRQMQIAIAHEYITSTFVKAGMCADWSLHDKQDGNVHVHCMLTMRPLKNGKWSKKESRGYKLDENGNRIPVLDSSGHQRIGQRGRKMWVREAAKSSGWNKKENVEAWRKAWAETCNKYLDKSHQIDNRSYKRQGIDKMPTIHLGYAALKRGAAGEMTERIDLNKKINEYNAIVNAIVKAENNVKKLVEGKRFVTENTDTEKKNKELRDYVFQKDMEMEIKKAEYRELYLKTMDIDYSKLNDKEKQNYKKDKERMNKIAAEVRPYQELRETLTKGTGTEEQRKYQSLERQAEYLKNNFFKNNSPSTPDGDGGDDKKSKEKNNKSLSKVSKTQVKINTKRAPAKTAKPRKKADKGRERQGYSSGRGM